MTWFKVDDGLHDHVKVRRVDDVAAVGLWTLAGSWCGQNRTDGFVPEQVLRRWSSSWRRLASKLVAAELWRADEANGERGYRFHDWEDWQPTRADTETPSAQLRWKRDQQLKRMRSLLEDVQARDGDRCRYCGDRVSWRDRRGAKGATYDHVDPDAGNTLANVVVACRRCNGNKRDRTPTEWVAAMGEWSETADNYNPRGGRHLLPAPDPGRDPGANQVATQVDQARDPRDGTEPGPNQVGPARNGPGRPGSGPGPSVASFDPDDDLPRDDEENPDAPA